MTRFWEGMLNACGMVHHCNRHMYIRYIRREDVQDSMERQHFVYGMKAGSIRMHGRA